jgi:hypothetical protein
MEEYCALVANVKNPEDVKAVEAQEPQLRAKAIDVSTQYVHAIQQNKAPRVIDQEALEKFTPLFKKFNAETERFDGLQKRSVSSRPKR